MSYSMSTEEQRAWEDAKAMAAENIRLKRDIESMEGELKKRGDVLSWEQVVEENSQLKEQVRASDKLCAMMRETLRDRFAMAVATGLFANGSGQYDNSDAYKSADSILSHREER